MLRIRVIPSLLISGSRLVKTVGFKNPGYIGDPINAIKIFNDKEVDELSVLDITASARGSIDYSLLSRINKEAFMPVSYGGGIRSTEDVEKILALGYEKVILDSGALKDPSLITRSSALCGSQSVVVCIDAKKDLFGGYRVYDHIGRKVCALKVAEWCTECERLGAGEIIVYSVDRDGTFSGYDTELIATASQACTVPLVALGGAAGPDDFVSAVSAGASAVAAGSMFVYYGRHRAVLITYPERSLLRRLLDPHAAKPPNTHGA